MTSEAHRLALQDPPAKEELAAVKIALFKANFLN